RSKTNQLLFGQPTLLPQRNTSATSLSGHDHSLDCRNKYFQNYRKAINAHDESPQHCDILPTGFVETLPLDQVRSTSTLQFADQVVSLGLWLNVFGDKAVSAYPY
ncbi:unnamed protein product, partial [Pleuronectes platessa]